MGTDTLDLFEDIPLEYPQDVVTKVCNKCNKELPLSFFSRHSGGNYKRPECKKCNNELAKVRSSLKQKYGDPPKGYSCPICLRSEEEVAGKGNNKNGSWVLDHCHERDIFRGWLCHGCNRSLGGFNDDPEVITRALAYLRSNYEQDN